MQKITKVKLMAKKWKKIVLKSDKEPSEESVRDCLIDPQNTYKLYWDVFITAVLIYSCLMTTLQMALYWDELSPSQKTANYIVDAFFLIDIFVIFNTAIQDEDLDIIRDRSVISSTYLRSWFIVDFIAIIPFDLMMNNGETANIVRYTRLGRLYKMLKLLKLIRVMKLQRSSNFSVINWLQ